MVFCSREGSQQQLPGREAADKSLVVRAVASRFKMLTPKVRGNYGMAPVLCKKRSELSVCNKVATRKHDLNPARCMLCSCPVGL